MNDRDLSLPGPREGQSHDEIAAEIADHLAATEAELAKGGATAVEARAAAIVKFGDVEKIKQTCYWIQNGETIMLRWTLVSLATVLCILLGLSVLGNWRAQTQLAEQMGKLSEELKAIAAAKQATPPALLPPAVSEITGVIYAGRKEKPVAHAGISIVKTDGTIIRKIACDENGRYRSGPLEAGDYCITTDTVNAPPPTSLNAQWATQSQPVYLHAASGSVSLDMDASFRQGKLKISASRALPVVHRPGKFYLTSRLHVFCETPRKRIQLWTTAAMDSPQKWPIYAATIQITGSGWPGSATALFQLKPGEEVPYIGRGDFEATIFPAESLPIRAVLLVHVFPMDGEEKAIANDLGSRRSLVDQWDSVLARDSGWGWWDVPVGKRWLDKLAGKPMPIDERHLKKYRIDDSQLMNFDLKEDAFTRLRAEIPEGIEQEIEQAIEKTTDAEEFGKLIENGLLQRPLKLTVVGHEPIGK